MYICEQKKMENTYISPVSNKELRYIKFQISSNLPKHLKYGNFGDPLFKNTISPYYIRRIALIIAYSVKEHEYDKSYKEQLLKVVFERLKSHPDDNIKRDAGRAMCEMSSCVKLYLETDFHPETRIQPGTPAPQKPQTRTTEKGKLSPKQIKRIEEFNRKNQRVTAIPTIYSNGFNSLYREQLKSRIIQNDSYEHGLSDAD